MKDILELRPDELRSSTEGIAVLTEFALVLVSSDLDLLGSRCQLASLQQMSDMFGCLDLGCTK